MDEPCFDDLTRSVSDVLCRRDILRGLAAAGLGLGAARFQETAGARKRKKKAKRPKPNAFGCLNVGDACKSAGQCCSGICEGKKGKRTCRAHNAGLCRPESDFCTSGVPALCAVNGAELSRCWLTTGKAAFCGFLQTDDCRDCARDEDCEQEFGPGAACVDLGGGICGAVGTCAETGGTACVAAVV